MQLHMGIDDNILDYTKCNFKINRVFSQIPAFIYGAIGLKSRKL